MRTKFDKFIEEIKDPNTLVKYCARFHQEEPRDVYYAAARDLVSKGDVMEGVRSLLMGWNPTTVRTGKKNKKRRGEEVLKKQFLGAYCKCEKLFDELRKKQIKLENVDPKDSKTAKKIKSIFREFARKGTIKYVGATKTMHLIYPELFMMWDSEIIKAYKPLGRSSFQSKARSKYPLAYLDFMEKCHEVAKCYKGTDIDELWTKHLDRLSDSKREFFKKFQPETLPKMIDECNYVRWRLGIRL